MKWQTRRIEEITRTSAGGTPLKAHKEYYDNGDIPWLLSGEVGVKDIKKSKNFITQLGLKSSSAKIFPRNTVLVAMYGATAGEVGILKFEACTNQAVCGILPCDELLPEYIYYFFLSYKDQLISQAVGNAQPNISQEKIKKTKIPMLPIQEQKRIVAILDQTFADIEKIRANTEKNLKNARELFESYLQQVFSKSGEGWCNSKLGDFCDVIGGGTPSKSKSKFYDGEIPWATVRDMKQSLLTTTEFKISKEAVNCSSTNVIGSDNVIIATRVGLGKVCILKQDTAINQDLKAIIPKSKKLEKLFLFWWLKSMSSTIENAGIGATVKGVKLPFIKNLQISFPSVPEQKYLVMKFFEVKQQTEILEETYNNKLSELDHLKKSLLQQAFTGQLTQQEVAA